MKKGNLKEMFEGYRGLILGNITAIKSLIDQAELLENMIKEIDDDEKRKKIESARQAIRDSIDELLKNTRELFDQYVLLMQEYVDK